ncbi:THUMP domain-containing protein 1-like [Saccoglossus kowalevskii]|uniref:THUMP domain-containing protein 1-like n=1 Tax=Saccoglossus kowalevskii TaxID=10224 RepID=A0ABM0MG65_SACKO|nr:PREDICTED: THUMP domain-containing protein 1-like [Saccoglossus kowalevskii]
MSQKRGKSYYRKSSNKRRKVHGILNVGMRGFLLTCNRDEKACVRDGLNLLTEYADLFYGPENDDKKESTDNDSDSEEDIEVSLEKEKRRLKEQIKNKTQRFQPMQSGANNVVFIRTQIDNPGEMAYQILTDIAKKSEKITRHIQRMIPVNGTCRTIMEDMEDLGSRLIDPFFHVEGTSQIAFSVQYKARNNGKVKRDEIIRMLASLVLKEGSPHKVDLNMPDITIIVEIIKNICCMSIVKNFHGLKKYNLHAVVEERLNESKDEPGQRCKEKEHSNVPDPVEKLANNESKDLCQRSEEKNEKVKSNPPAIEEGNKESDNIPDDKIEKTKDDPREILDTEKSMKDERSDKTVDEARTEDDDKVDGKTGCR